MTGDGLIDPGPRKDWVRRPGAAFLWWCLPLIVAFTAGGIDLPERGAALVWGTAFSWMGTGCLLNARRCHRLHCYFSAPIFFIGAGVSALLASGRLSLGPHSLGNVVSATLVGALLSFVPEIVRR